MRLQNYALGEWVAGTGTSAELFNAVLSGVAPPPAAPEEAAGDDGPKKAAKKPGKQAEA